MRVVYGLVFLHSKRWTLTSARAALRCMKLRATDVSEDPATKDIRARVFPADRLRPGSHTRSASTAGISVLTAELREDAL